MMTEELYDLSPGMLYLLSLALSLAVCLYITGKVIYVTRKVKIYDTPDGTRKTHGVSIPSLGGIGIFAAYATVGGLFMWGTTIGWNIIMISSVLLLVTGVYDDMMNMSPLKKLGFQLIATTITVYGADIRMTGLMGLFGVGELPYAMSILITVFTCAFFINVFNFIDGIDGLACTLAVLYAGIIGTLFALMGHTTIACVLLSIMGGALGLLWYNRSPARIYMGDTGSMLLGFSLFIFGTLLLQRITYETGNPLVNYFHQPRSVFVLLIALFFLPVYDGLRVFALRMMQGVSPMKADRQHLHYYLLDAGCSHTGAVAILALLNLSFVALAWLLQDMNPNLPLACVLVLAIVATLIIKQVRNRRQLAK